MSSQKWYAMLPSKWQRPIRPFAHLWRMKNGLIADVLFLDLEYTSIKASTSRISFLLQSRGRPVPTGFWTNKSQRPKFFFGLFLFPSAVV
jgi:hypothetical protein